MQLDYTANYNNLGENIIRIFNFTNTEAAKLRDAIQFEVLQNRIVYDVENLHFVKAINCSLKFRISEEDEGILTIDEKQFFCCLTTDAYKKMLQLIEPYCNKNLKTYTWLYDVDNENSLLFAPAAIADELD